MTDANSTCTCQVCGTQYAPTLNKDGSRRKTKYMLCSDPACGSAMQRRGPKRRPRVTKPCECCGAMMNLPASRAENQKACSLSCSSTLKARAKGYPSRAKHIVCAYCYTETTVTAYKNRDRVRFCSVRCRASMVSKIAAECAVIRKFAGRKARERKARIKKEIDAIRRIGRNIRAQGVCQYCSKLYSRKKLFQRYCSETCSHSAKAEAKDRHRASDAYRAAKRRGKSRRRAVLRGCEHESIDPIKVFERDGWRCHLCGIKTPRRLRGTIKDNAPELEHIVSLADGGSHTWGNVACSCRRCNIAKGAESRGQLGFGFAA